MTPLTSRELSPMKYMTGANSGRLQEQPATKAHQRHSYRALRDPGERAPPEREPEVGDRDRRQGRRREDEQDEEGERDREEEEAGVRVGYHLVEEERSMLRRRPRSSGWSSRTSRGRRRCAAPRLDCCPASSFLVIGLRTSASRIRSAQTYEALPVDLTIWTTGSYRSESKRFYSTEGLNPERRVGAATAKLI